MKDNCTLNTIINFTIVIGIAVTIVVISILQSRGTTLTTIIGIRHNDGVLMAADRQVSGWHEKDGLRHAKLFQRNNMLISVCGDLRTAQLINYHMTLRPMYEAESPMAYLTGAFSDAISEMFEKYKVNVDVGYGGLIALKGELYTFGSHKAIVQTANGYEAEGSGAAFALGALAITDGVILDLDVRAQRVMEIAARHDLYTSAPFDIMRQEKPE